MSAARRAGSRPSNGWIGKCLSVEWWDATPGRRVTQQRCAQNSATAGGQLWHEQGIPGHEAGGILKGIKNKNGLWLVIDRNESMLRPRATTTGRSSPTTRIRSGATSSSGPLSPHPPRYAFVIGMRRSRPNARGVILIPGGAWRRLYSARSTSVKTRSTASSGRPLSASCSRPASSSM